MSALADARFVARPAPRLAAAALSLGVHVVFVVMLVFGVSWQTQPAAPVSVDLWAALPPAPPPSRPQPVTRPEPAKPAPVPKTAEPPPKAPDIALEKKKAEAARAKQAAEEKARIEVAAREKQRAEQQRIEAQRQREQQRQQEEMELMRRMADAEAAEASRLTQEAEARAAASRRQAAAVGVIAQYRELISAKVRGNTRLPDNLKGNPEVRIQVRLLPTGEVQRVQLTRSSGNPAYDDAVLRAIEKSSPLPLPADRDARAAFVPELSFVHRPKD